MTSEPLPRPTPAWYGGLAAVLSLAAWVRLALFPKILLEGGVYPSDGDADYHLRRILFAAESFPRVAAFDPLLGWPLGAVQPWAPGFDFAGAAWVLLTGAAGDPERALIAACLFPVVLGVLVVWATTLVYRQVVPTELGRWSALAAGAVTALIPQSVAMSRFARVDHHVWEALSMLLLASWAVKRFELTAASGLRARLGFEAFGAVVAAAAVLGFTGGPLYVAFAAALLVVAALRTPAGVVGSGALGLVVAAGAVLAGFAPSLTGATVTFQFPSLLQPALLLAAAVAVGVAALVSGRMPNASPTKRVAVVLAAAVGLALLATVVAGGAVSEVLRALGSWLGKSDPWLARISEFQPLFAGGRDPLERALFFFGGWGLVGLPLAAVGAPDAVRRHGARAAALLAVFVGLGVLTLLQSRFGRVCAPFLALAGVLGLQSLVLRALAKRPEPALGVQRAAMLGVVALLALGDPEVRDEVMLADERPLAPLEEMVRALDTGPDRSVVGRRNGVLAPWDLGSTVVGAAQRGVIASGFGSYVDPEGFRAAEQTLSAAEPALLALMTERDLGFVVTGALPLLRERLNGRVLLGRTADGRGVLDVEWLRARPGGVLALAGTGLAAERIAHVEHLMPIAASREILKGVAFPLPALWAYERVEGARLVGHATPASTVLAGVELTLPAGKLTWTGWTVAAADGTFTLVVPVPCSYTGHGFFTAAQYRASVDGVEKHVTVTEADVRSGARLEL